MQGSVCRVCMQGCVCRGAVCCVQGGGGGQLTDHSHPRLSSQGRTTRPHPHLRHVALVIKEQMDGDDKESGNDDDK